ncbi:MAG: transketolase C-terminal domain-containing protein [Candidatus Sericytochromatia bacterium]|nr:transketolase C-terminal domain-containing protein [Candidatus Sericytochromatia bacterium]
MSSRTYRDALADAMNWAMEAHDHTLIIGQGVSDFKGLFGTTSGLAERHPNRVIETPLAEDSIAGICIGAALNGMYPINTHIRADFGLLVFNQLINLAAKYRYMFGGLFEVPMMMRMIIGRSWGQGAQHSQSLQSLLAHIPGLVVVMPASPQSILSSYRFAIEKHRGPVVMFEHRLMYELEFEERQLDSEISIFGSYKIREGTDVTIVATSVMLLEANRAANYVADYGISVEVIDLHSVSHPDYAMILSSVSKTGRLLVADTSWVAYGVSAEVNRAINEVDPGMLKAPTVSLGMQPSPCPTAKALEDLYYPDMHDLVDAIAKLYSADSNHRIPLPAKQPIRDYYKHFSGPF